MSMFVTLNIAHFQVSLIHYTIDIEDQDDQESGIQHQVKDAFLGRHHSG